MMFLWSFAALAAAVYCLARAVVDFRHGKYVWAVLGLISSAIVLLTPIQTHAVKIDLPAP